MAEINLKTITITKIIKAPPTAVFKALLTPEDIVQYHYADEDWITPYAESDAKPGGKFKIGFKSPDNKNNFDFEGIYTEIIEPEKIAYKIADGRPVTYTLKDESGQTKLDLELGLEEEHNEEQQRDGWTKIINHLAEHLGNN